MAIVAVTFHASALTHPVMHMFVQRRQQEVNNTPLAGENFRLNRHARHQARRAAVDVEHFRLQGNMHGIA